VRVFDLQCQLNHVFEGWFGSEEDYLQQKQRGLLQCPICNSHEIHKRLSAPRLNFGAKSPHQNSELDKAQPENQKPRSQEQGATSNGLPANLPSASSASPNPQTKPADFQPSEQDILAIQGAILELARKVIANTEDVGERFADEARLIHYGDAPERPIRGQASEDEKASLREEGIEIHEVLIPKAANETLQ
jgi:hypothetical protein